MTLQLGLQLWKEEEEKMFSAKNQGSDDTQRLVSEATLALSPGLAFYNGLNDNYWAGLFSYCLVYSVKPPSSQ